MGRDAVGPCPQSRARGRGQRKRTRIGDSVIHVRTRTPNAEDSANPAVPWAFEYLYRDHLGSVEAVTDQAVD